MLPPPYRASLSNQSGGADNAVAREEHMAFRGRNLRADRCGARLAARRSDVPAAAGAERRRFLQGQDRRSLHRLQRRRRLRSLRAPCSPATWASTFPAIPTVRAEEHGGRRHPAARQLALQRRPKDGTAFGTIGRGTGFDPLLGNTKRAVRRHQVHLDRQRQQRGQRLRRLEHQRHHQVRGHADQGADRRRHRHRRPTPTSSRRSPTACSAPR